MQLSESDLKLMREAIELAQCELHTEQACIQKGPLFPNADAEIAEIGHISGELTALDERIEAHMREKGLL